MKQGKDKRKSLQNYEGKKLTPKKSNQIKGGHGGGPGRPGRWSA